MLLQFCLDVCDGCLCPADQGIVDIEKKECFPVIVNEAPPPPTRLLQGLPLKKSFAFRFFTDEVVPDECRTGGAEVMPDEGGCDGGM
jgi:hypothetical protein